MSKRNLAVTMMAALTLARPAWAAGVRTADQPLVVLTEEGRQDAEDAAFFSSVRALAAEIGIGVSAHEVSTFEAVRDTLLAEARQRSKPFLVAWIVREPGLRKVHLFDPWKNQLRTREVEAGASDTANAETLALILRAELLAYLSEPPPPAPMVRVEPPPPPAPPPRPEPHYVLAAGYAAESVLRDRGVQQGLRLGLGYRWVHLRAAISHGFFAGQDVGAEEASITVRRYPLAVDLGYASAERRRLRFVAETLVSGEWVTRHTSFAAAPLSAQPDDHRFLIGVGLRARTEVRIVRNLALYAALGAEALLNPHDFEAAKGTATTTIARLSPVRIMGEAGLHLLGF